VTRLILLIILGGVATYYLPESRAAMVDVTQPVLNPAFRWHSLQEMTRIAGEIQVYERDNFGRIPDPRVFPSWLASNFSEGATRDAWGSPYLLFIERDSFVVVSWGPDRMPRTDDDLRVAREMARARR
jgi:hypothetical protein